MTCPHQLALCKRRDCAPCEHHGDEEHCPFAHGGDTTPTFLQMFGVYAAKGVSRRTRSVIASVTSDLARVGLAADSRCTDMTRTRFKTLISLLTSPLSNLRGATVQSHLAAFRAIVSDSLEDVYNERGFDLPQFSIPKVEVGRVKVQEVSDRTIRKVEIQMEKWLASGRESDREAYKFCFFALYCGMRAGDICNATWSVLKSTTAGMMVVYTPHKTLRSTGVTVSFPMDNKTYCKIEPLVGAPDEYVIRRHGNRTPRHVTKDGEYSGMHVYLRNKVNGMLSLCGIGNEYRGQKKTHALRKYFETDRALANGRTEAANACGHSLEVQKRSYLGTLHGKVM